MPLNGTGTFAPIEPEFPAIPETTILASEFNTIITDISEALSLSLYKDGQAVVLANIDWGDNKIINLAPGSNDKDAVNFDQVFHNPTFVGSLADGVILSGTKTTINSTLLEINSDTVEIDSANIGIHASDNLLLDSDSILNLESPSITLDALNDINLLSALTTINSPSIVLTGDTLATLNTNTTAITQLLTDSSTRIATTEFVNNKIVSQTFPVGVGNNHTLLSQDAGVAIWSDKIDSTIIEFMDGTDNTKQFKLLASSISPNNVRSLIIPDANTTLVGTDTSQTITSKTINQIDNNFTLQDNADITKQARFECSAISTGQTRIITIPDENVTLGNSTRKLLQTFTSTALNFWEILPTTIDNSYDIYEFEFWGVTSTRTAGSETVGIQFKANNAYITTGYAYTSTSWSGTYIYVDDLQATSATSGSYMFGVIKFYMPWSTTFKKFGFITTSNVEGFKDSTNVINSFGHQTLLPLQGFKFQHFASGASLFPTNAVGKWYGLK